MPTMPHQKLCHPLHLKILQAAVIATSFFPFTSYGGGENERKDSGAEGKEAAFQKLENLYFRIAKYCSKHSTMRGS